MCQSHRIPSNKSGLSQVGHAPRTPIPPARLSLLPPGSGGSPAILKQVPISGIVGHQSPVGANRPIQVFTQRQSGQEIGPRYRYAVAQPPIHQSSISSIPRRSIIQTPTGGYGYQSTSYVVAAPAAAVGHGYRPMSNTAMGPPQPIPIQQSAGSLLVQHAPSYAFPVATAVGTYSAGTNTQHQIIRTGSLQPAAHEHRTTWQQQQQTHLQFQQHQQQLQAQQQHRVQQQSLFPMHPVSSVIPVQRP